MRVAIGVPNVGPFGDPELLVELAVAAEAAGWDGWFLWDHLLYRDPTWPVADPTVTVAAVAAATERLRLGILMVALPRRRPWLVAKQLATLDRLSGGRLVTGFGLGSLDEEYAAFGEDPDLRDRAARLDEGLEVVARSWRGETFSYAGRHHRVTDVRMLPTPVQTPRPPVWLAGRWPNRAPFARAARWDGVMPIHADFGQGRTMPPATVAEVADTIRSTRGTLDGFDIALEGATAATEDPDRLATYAEAGVTWWVEALGWWRGDVDAARARVAAGPVRASVDGASVDGAVT